MSKINITIDTDNNAFDGENRGLEIARILRKIADEYDSGAWISSTICDINGNPVCEVYDDESHVKEIAFSEFEEEDAI